MQPPRAPSVDETEAGTTGGNSTWNTQEDNGLDWLAPRSGISIHERSLGKDEEAVGGKRDRSGCVRLVGFASAGIKHTTTTIATAAATIATTTTTTITTTTTTTPTITTTTTTVPTDTTSTTLAPSVLNGNARLVGREGPFALLTGTLAPELVAWLLADPSVQEVVSAGLEHPQAYYRGHKAKTVHCVGDDATRKADLVGFDHDGLHEAAGPRLFAFAQCLRQQNIAALHLLEARLRSEGHLDDLPDFLLRCFGAATVQSFVAHGCEEKGNEVVGSKDVESDAEVALDWHADGAASVLHLALTLSGHRIMRYQHFAPETIQRDGEGGSDGLKRVTGGCEAFTERQEGSLHQGPADVYLTSPTAFEHAVDRLPLSADSVSVHFRLAVPPHAMPSLQRSVEHTEPDRSKRGLVETDYSFAVCVADWLLETRLALPSLGEVLTFVEAPTPT